jgi:hypothetical protein
VTAANGEEAAAEHHPDVDRQRLKLSARDVLAIVTPTGLLTGILYYFGYVSTKAYYGYFGVSLSALNLSASSYLISNADTFFKPAATLLIILIGLFVVHYLLVYALKRAGERWARAVALGLCLLAAVFAGIGLFGLYGPSGGLLSAISLAAAGLVLEYGVWLASRYGALSPRISGLRTGVNLRRGLIIALVVTAAFWATTDLAYQQGIATASLVQLSLPLQPQAVVYSAEDLHLPVSAYNVTSLGGADTAYHFRYDGLRPLVYAQGRWFLLPVTWTPDNGETVIVLEDDPSRVRVDLAP